MHQRLIFIPRMQTGITGGKLDYRMLRMQKMQSIFFADVSVFRRTLPPHEIIPSSFPLEVNESIDLRGERRKRKMRGGFHFMSWLFLTLLLIVTLSQWQV